LLNERQVVDLMAWVRIIDVEGRIAWVAEPYLTIVAEN
jgi:hypothetical protein